MTLLRVALVLAVVAVPACKKSAKERAVKAASAEDFWPEAPKATKPAGTRTFAYKPENVNGFSLVASGGTPAGATASIDFVMTMNVGLAAGKTPREREATIEKLDATINVMSQRIKMRLDRDEM